MNIGLMENIGFIIEFIKKTIKFSNLSVLYGV